MTKIEELEMQLNTAIEIIAEWCDAVRDGGAEWSNWKMEYKRAAFERNSIRELIDTTRTPEPESEWGNTCPKEYRND